MVGFFPCSLFEFGAYCFVFRGERLAGVQRLRAHFADVVDAHQRGGIRTLGFAQVRFRPCAGIGASGVRAGEDGAQAEVEGGDELVKFVHGYFT
jgi:hypothetical protein